MPHPLQQGRNYTFVKESGSALVEYLLISVLISVSTLVVHANLAKHADEILVASTTALTDGGGPWELGGGTEQGHEEDEGNGFL